MHCFENKKYISEKLNMACNVLKHNITIFENEIQHVENEIQHFEKGIQQFETVFCNTLNCFLVGKK